MRAGGRRGSVSDPVSRVDGGAGAGGEDGEVRMRSDRRHRGAGRSKEAQLARVPRPAGLRRLHSTESHPAAVVVVAGRVSRRRSGWCCARRRRRCADDVEVERADRSRSKRNPDELAPTHFFHRDYLATMRTTSGFLHHPSAM